MIRIAIPCHGDQVSAHFGHAESFAFFDVDPNSGAIKGEYHLDPPPHQPGVLPEWIAGQQAQVVLAGGIGVRAEQLFRQHGIELVAGITTGTPRAAVTAYLNGTLDASNEVCDHDGHHDCH